MKNYRQPAFLLFMSIALCPLAQVPTLGLTGYWPFHANPNDLSGNNNNGIVHGATLTTDRFGNCNEAYRFDGTDDYILVHSAPAVDMLNTDFSIALWVKTANNDSNGLPLCKNTYGSWSGYFFATNSSDYGYCATYKHAFFYVAAGSQQEACSDNGLDTSWHFFTGVYDRTQNRAYFYLDAVQQLNPGQASGPTSNGEDLAFGAHNTGITDFFTGVLDDIRIYKRMLTLQEITQLYHESSPVSNAGNGWIRDTTICPSSSVSLDAGPATSYTWSNGSTSQVITVNAPGVYWVQAWPQGGCLQRDTFKVSAVNPAAYTVLKDTTICSNSNYALNAAFPGATGYSWSTGATNPSIPVTSSGTYWVDIHINQCIVRDSAEVKVINTPSLSIGDTVICKNPIVFVIPDTSVYVTWWNGDHSHQQTIDVTCTDVKVFTVKPRDISSDLSIVPNIITPNGDGINDLFELNLKDVIIKSFSLYNRWGRLVYSSSGNISWDGKQSNDLADDGTYYWTLSLTNECDERQVEVKKSGFLTVLK
jgi:gliding motility-associated-like protein